MLITGGAAILSRKGERGGALLLAAFYGLWVLALHLPLAIARSRTSARGTVRPKSHS